MKETYVKLGGQMRPFDQRLKEASAFAGIDYSCTAIGRSLGISKQTVYMWMSGSEPKAAMIFHIADSWHVDARWLATGDGTMKPPSNGPGLSADEIEMIKQMRKAPQRNRASMIAVAKSLCKVGVLVAFLSGGLAFNKTSVAQSLAPSAKEIHIVRHRFRALWRAACRALASCVPTHQIAGNTTAG